MGGVAMTVELPVAAWWLVMLMQQVWGEVVHGNVSTLHISPKPWTGRDRGCMRQITFT